MEINLEVTHPPVQYANSRSYIVDLKLTELGAKLSDQNTELDYCKSFVIMIAYQELVLYITFLGGNYGSIEDAA